MVILVVFNSFNVIKNLKKPDPIARLMPPLYTTISKSNKLKNCVKKESKFPKDISLEETSTNVPTSTRV